MDKTSEDDTEIIRNEVKSLLLPLGRSLVTNWKLGNRREAGIALAHVTGSMLEATTFVNSLSRLLKKVNESIHHVTLCFFAWELTLIFHWLVRWIL